MFEFIITLIYIPWDVSLIFKTFFFYRLCSKKGNENTNKKKKHQPENREK